MRRARSDPMSDRFLQLLGRPEGDLLAGLDLDLLARGRVAPEPGGTRADLEDPKAIDTDLGPFRQVFGEGLQELAQHALDLPLRHVMALCQPGRQLLQADRSDRGCFPGGSSLGLCRWLGFRRWCGFRRRLAELCWKYRRLRRTGLCRSRHSRTLRFAKA